MSLREGFHQPREWGAPGVPGFPLHPMASLCLPEKLLPEPSLSHVFV